MTRAGHHITSPYVMHQLLLSLVNDPAMYTIGHCFVSLLFMVHELVTFCVLKSNL